MHLKNSSPSLFPFAAELTCCSRDRDLGGLCHGLGSDVGHPQWDLQDVSGREQQELLMIPQDWIPKWLLSEDPTYGKPRAGNLWAPEMVSSCISLFIWPSPAFQQSTSAAPRTCPSPWGPCSHPAQSHTEWIHASLGLTPSSVQHKETPVSPGTSKKCWGQQNPECPEGTQDWAGHEVLD